MIGEQPAEAEPVGHCKRVRGHARIRPVTPAASVGGYPLHGTDRAVAAGPLGGGGGDASPGTGIDPRAAHAVLAPGGHLGTRGAPQRTARRGQPGGQRLRPHGDHAGDGDAGQPDGPQRALGSRQFRALQDAGPQVQHPAVTDRGRLHRQAGPHRARQQVLARTRPVIHPGDQDHRLRARNRLLHRPPGGHPPGAHREQRLGHPAAQRPGPGLGQYPRRILIHRRHALAGVPPDLLIQQLQQHPAPAAGMDHAGRHPARLLADRHGDHPRRLRHQQQRIRARLAAGGAELAAHQQQQPRTHAPPGQDRQDAAHHLRTALPARVPAPRQHLSGNTAAAVNHGDIHAGCAQRRSTAANGRHQLAPVRRGRLPGKGHGRKGAARLPGSHGTQGAGLT